MKEFTLGKLKYLMKFPEDFSNGGKYPVLIYLHGSGTRGQDTKKLSTNAFFQQISKHERFPFVVVAPLCSENTWFDLWELLKQLVLNVSRLPYVDNTRIYLTGNSMGGYGTWQLAMSIPEYFAAIVPVCGGGMYWNTGRLKNVPVWAFHGAKDQVVFPAESVNMVDKVNEKGGNAKLTIYPENAHDAWNDTYGNYEVFQWLLQHTRKEALPLVDEYINAEIYG